MKNLTFAIIIILFSHNMFSQELGNPPTLSYKGFPIEELEYYYMSSEPYFSSGKSASIYSSVKQFTCDKSKYLGSIRNLSDDLKSQFDDHIGDRKLRGFTTSVHYFKSARDANISHRKIVNSGNVELDYMFKYYCQD